MLTPDEQANALAATRFETNTTTTTVLTNGPTPPLSQGPPSASLSAASSGPAARAAIYSLREQVICHAKSRATLTHGCKE